MLLAAASTELAFRSGIFWVAISRICFSVTLPIFSLFGVPSPSDARGLHQQHRRRRRLGNEAKLRSAYTVITTGMVMPFISGGLVRALNCLQNSMMLTCAWPSAGPTGGAGVAFPPMIWSLTYPVILRCHGAILVRLLAAGAWPAADFVSQNFSLH